MIEKNITFSRRMEALLIDGMVIMGISVPLIILSLILGFLGLANNVNIRILLLSLIYSLILCKDLYHRQSVGKKSLNLKLVSISNKELTPFKLIIRNIFIVLWPIEILMCTINPQRRLGDILVGSKLVYDESKNEISNLKESIIVLVIVMVLCYSLFYFIVYTFIPENVIRLLYS